MKKIYIKKNIDMVEQVEIEELLKKDGNDYFVMKAIKLFFVNYFNFSGRASRAEFWWVYLALTLIAIVPLVGTFHTTCNFYWTYFADISKVTRCWIFRLVSVSTIFNFKSVNRDELS